MRKVNFAPGHALVQVTTDNRWPPREKFYPLQGWVPNGWITLKVVSHETMYKKETQTQLFTFIYLCLYWGRWCCQSENGEIGRSWKKRTWKELEWYKGRREVINNTLEKINTKTFRNPSFHFLLMVTSKELKQLSRLPSDLFSVLVISSYITRKHIL